EASPAAATAHWTYAIETAVPPFWIPMLPVQAGSRTVRLQMRAMLDEQGNPLTPLGRILDPSSGPLEVPDEEVPRDGTRVRRRLRYVRWTDGSSLLWSARQRSEGRGEGSAGLRFD